MGRIYMISKSFVNIREIDTNLLPCMEDGETESVILANWDDVPVFYNMKRVYKFLDDWKMSHANTTLLLVVDPGTAKIVNSYFFDMSARDYENFSAEDGKIWQFFY